MKKETLYIFGGKSTALEIAEAADLIDASIQVIHVVGDHEDADGAGMIRISGLARHTRQNGAEAGYIVSMANHALRAQCLSTAGSLNLSPRTLIHPAAAVSQSATIGVGCYIAAGACVSANAQLGNHSILNLNVTYGHDARSGEHLIVNPGAAISGNVTLGNRILIGANAFLFQGITVGDDCQVDALTYVARDLEPNQLATSRQMRVYPRKPNH